MTAPTIVSYDTFNFASSSYEVPVPEVSDGTLVLFVMSGGANPVPSAVPDSISGMGRDWQVLGGGISVNTRISGSGWAARGGASPGGSLTLTFPSEQTRISYYLLTTDRDLAQSTSASSGASTIRSSLPSPPSGLSGVLTAVSVNATSLVPLGDEGQQLVSDLAQFASPVGRMYLYWQEAATADQSFSTSGTISKISVSAELRSNPGPSDSVRAYLVVNGSEVPASLSMVEGGVERPAALDYLGA